jgi:hypothetical protein
LSSDRTVNQQRTQKQVNTANKGIAKKATNFGASAKTNEKGWISLTSTKAETHNFHLRNRQRVAMANFKVNAVCTTYFLEFTTAM